MFEQKNSMKIPYKEF